MAADFYSAAITRIKALTGVVAAVGTTFAFITHGAAAALGFFAGAVLSLINFHLLCGFANIMGGSPSRAKGVMIALRYAIIGVAVYVIVRVLGTAPVAVLAGLLAVFAAVLLEIIYELILHART